MLDFQHIMSTPGYDIQTFYGTENTANLKEWQIWRKPRGVKWIYMFGVAGGASGGCGVNTSTTSGGGSGGGSGGQTSVLIPAIFVPDILYIQGGAGGKQPAPLVSGALAVAGVGSYIAAEPYTVFNAGLTFLFAQGAAVGTAAATTTTGGTATTGAAAASFAFMPLAGRGYVTFIAGQAGAAGGASTPTAGISSTLPVTGSMVAGGAGGGGTSGAAGAAGGSIAVTTAALGSEFFYTSAGGIAGVGATNAGFGNPGMIVKNYLFNYPGSGGGSSSGTAGSLAGAGGMGAPGSGGGGAGGSTTTNPTLARPGNGGDGFVIMISF